MMSRALLRIIVLVSVLLGGACSDGSTPDPTGSGGTSGSGGTQATGGSAGSGGSSAGQGGTSATGGSPGSGGAPATGGTAGTGGVAAAGGVGGLGGVGGVGGVGGTGGGSAYPAGPYGHTVGATFPNLQWQGYVNDTAVGLANQQPWVAYSMDAIRTSGKRYALVHVSEFF